MNKILLILIFTNALFAKYHYAKLEAFNTYFIKSAVSGKVIYANNELEGQKANNSIIIQIDSYTDKIDLEQSLLKLKAINEMIGIENDNYKRLLKLSSKSKFDKDRQKLKVINLKITKSDILVKIAKLKNNIKNKTLFEKENYIYKINVKAGDYVNAGSLLYQSKDLSKAKVEIFIPILEIEHIKTKAIYIDNKKTNLKIYKIYKVADEKHISSYKVEILIPTIKTFSRLVKIEFK